MLGGAFGAAADGRASSELAEARIGTRRPRRRVSRLERRLLVVRPHGRKPLPPPLAAYRCRFRSRLATWPDAGARRRQSPLPADDTRHCTTARRFGLPPVSARWKRQLLETRTVLVTDKGKSRASVGVTTIAGIKGFWWIQKGALPVMRDFADQVPKIPQRYSWNPNPSSAIQPFASSCSSSRRTLSRARCRTDSGNGADAACLHKPTVSRSPLTTAAHRSQIWQCCSIASHAEASSSPSRKAEMPARIARHSGLVDSVMHPPGVDAT